MDKLKIAVIGTGISGLSAAWLLSARHHVTVYESADRLGGHSNTVTVSLEGKSVPIDTGFIVFNRHTYPNLTALFAHLGVDVEDSDMSFGISLDGGSTEYHCGGFGGVFAQKRNLLRPRHWRMVRDIMRFQREAPADMARLAGKPVALGDYLREAGYSRSFQEDHLLPMASAIWSTSHADTLAYPAHALVRFFQNHGLLTTKKGVLWETVSGGSRNYVTCLARALSGNIRLECPATAIRRRGNSVIVTDATGTAETYDHVVLASHADQSLAMLSDADVQERSLLGVFRYSRNLAVLHSDTSFMPKNPRVWSSWNFVGQRQAPQEGVAITYWMNRLQKLGIKTPIFVTLNPERAPRHGTLLHSEIYHHPVFDTATAMVQKDLWSLQGHRNTWFCGAYFGAGFHEDGLQAGLAVAEQLGAVRRPWNVENESGRIHLSPRAHAVVA
jgi:predicted NAD/FAD-binding protein